MLLLWKSWKPSYKPEEVDYDLFVDGVYYANMRVYWGAETEWNIGRHLFGDNCGTWGVARTMAHAQRRVEELVIAHFKEMQ